MTIKLTAASFLNGLKQSGLVDADRLDGLVVDLQRDGVDCQDSAAISQALVQRGLITEWQAEKLRQGRHKGFILGRYRLLSLLGAGEMSAVYLAEHLMMERRCAIKVLPANRVQDTSYLGRFHREAKAVAALNHSNIVRAYDVDKQTEGGTDIHFLVMEYVEGKNLDKVVKENGPIDFVTAVDVIRQGADGLQHAHMAGLVHRDVKPENLLIDPQGVVKLLDMGLARFFKSSDEESLTIKHDEKVLGTADYLAPEQAIDSHKVDARADIYSLGCSLYFALTGHPPFTDGSLVQRLMAHQTRKPPAVTVDRPDCPESLKIILEKMMAKKPDDRYQSATEVSEVLSRWLIENAPQEWKQRHLMLVAALCGMEALQPKAAAVAVSAGTVDGNQSSDAVSVLPTGSETPSVNHALFDTVAATSAGSSSKKIPRPPSSKPIRSGGQRNPDRVKSSGSPPMSSAPSKSGSPPRVAVTPKKPSPASVIPATPRPAAAVAARDPIDWQRRGWVLLLAVGMGMLIWIGVWALNRNAITSNESNQGNRNRPAATTLAQPDLFREL